MKEERLPIKALSGGAEGRVPISLLSASSHIGCPESAPSETPSTHLFLWPSFSVVQSLCIRCDPGADAGQGAHHSLSGVVLGSGGSLWCRCWPMGIPFTHWECAWFRRGSVVCYHCWATALQPGPTAGVPRTSMSARSCGAC
jgi:hypothetical protein